MPSNALCLIWEVSTFWRVRLTNVQGAVAGAQLVICRRAHRLSCPHPCSPSMLAARESGIRWQDRYDSRNAVLYAASAAALGEESDSRALDIHRARAASTSSIFTGLVM